MYIFILIINVIITAYLLIFINNYLTLEIKILLYNVCQIFYFSNIILYLREKSLVYVKVFLQNLQQIRLKKGSEMRDFWEKLPQPLDFNLYVFNVTNPTEIKSGSKPIVQEVGPFHYE